MAIALDNPRTVQAKIRYGKRSASATITSHKDWEVHVLFSEPQRAVTPGQSIVFYEDDVVLGGGIIDQMIV